MSIFVPGLELSERFFHEVVKPILDRISPQLAYSAAKLHRGSEVLGFDTEQSMDHDWGPSKIDIFVREDEWANCAAKIEKLLSQELPDEFHGLPTRFLSPEEDGGKLAFSQEGMARHRIRVTTVDRFFREYIGLNPLEEIRPVDWLLIPPQFLCTIRSGKVFHDGLGTLTEAKNRLSWYPRDIWLYLLACQWRRIEQEEPFMARCGDVGDELGSRLVAARLVNEIMRLCFLMERQYWPYYKWFGSAFARLQCADVLKPILDAVFKSENWKERESHLSSAYLYLAELHNSLELTEYVEPRIDSFHTRPYQVPHSERFVAALNSEIVDPRVRELPLHLGGIGQYVDSTDVLDRIHRCRALISLYQPDVK